MKLPKYYENKHETGSKKYIEPKTNANNGEEISIDSALPFYTKLIKLMGEIKISKNVDGVTSNEDFNFTIKLIKRWTGSK